MDARFEMWKREVRKLARAFQHLCAPSVCLTFLLLSCMPEPLEVDDITFPETKIVVSSMILPDHSVAVLLTKSIGALEANKESDPQALISDIAINDADVSITVNDSVYPLKFLQDGVYQGI